MMSRRIFLINLALLGAIVLCAQQLVSGWQEYRAESSLQQVLQGEPENETAELPVLPESEQTVAPFPDFMVIYERTLFSQDRRMEAEAPEQVDVPQPPEFPKRPQMKGLASIGGEPRALMTLFSAANDNGGESRMVQAGDMVQGYVVDEITPTTVTLRWNDRKEIIDIMDAEATREGQTERASDSRAVNIINIGSAAPAVESSSTSDADEGEEERGVSVSAVQGPQGGRRGPAGNLSRGSSRVPGRSGRQGGGRLPGTVGIPQQQQQSPQNQQNPPN